MVDWDLAVATAGRLAGSGPAVSDDEARAAVAELRALAAQAERHVAAFTGLDASATSAPLVVVDRGNWARANAQSMRTIIAPLERKLRKHREPSPFQKVGPKVTGLQTGALLAFLATKVLGQFDPFWSGPIEIGPAGSPAGNGAAGTTGEKAHGRLLLVAPNIVHVERELGVDPHDFRLWVTLHEETHRVQFTAVPWLRDHLAGEIEAFVAATDVDPTAFLTRARDAVRAMAESARSADGNVSILDLVQTPAQKAVIDRVTAFMSLLEGHADVVMDGVGPEVIPSVETIRRRFQRRRYSSVGLDRTLRRLLGLDAKMRQYRDGAAFVNTVVDQVGMAGFNRVWESADTLPTKEEIADPVAWVRRVHGG
ncbi:zinc-dependent metalloprotease [Jiangella asiatica]|uniref:Coenzyme F420 biosynthesis-associated protein n=1 Tax=Jiangella asiatica TaxID=2530372 RepID=A0A4R5C7I7_9ACTN|nr:coenzyme F420 biosynthesis-associated protein [Jiangella asiatica]